MALALWIAGVLGTVIAVIALYLSRRDRHRDAATEARAVVERLVRECEGRRVLWNPFAWEEPAPSYDSVQALRRAVRTARGQLPPKAQGAAQLDVMKQSAEQFCDQFEAARRSAISGGDRPLQGLIDALRQRFVPALAELQGMYGIETGHRPDSANPFIGEIIREVHFAPEDEA